MVEAVTLAHAARCYSLASRLDPARYEVTIARHPRFDFLFETEWTGKRPAMRDIHSISTEHFTAALASGAPIYRLDMLKKYAEEDLRVMDSVDPDVVIGDFRLSLSATARVAGKPLFNLTNAGWSPFGCARFSVPDIALTRVVGARAGQWLFDATRSISFAAHARPLNRLRASFGLPPLPTDLRHVYTDGDRVLYADLPALFPLADAPATHRFIGPIVWSPRQPDPPWIDRLAADRPIVYVALGSSGRHALLPTIVKGLLDELAQSSFALVVASPVHASLPKSPNLFASNYLDGNTWASRARLVVGNGGSPSCYQSLSTGTPVLGIPSNLDQYLNMDAVERSGAGALLRSGNVTARRVAESARRLLDDPAARAAAESLRRSFDGYDAGLALSEALDETFPEALATP